MNYNNYLEKIFKVKLYELTEKNKNVHRKILGSLASINALKSSTAVHELSDFFIKEIKDISEIFLDCLKETVKVYPELIEFSSVQIIEMYYRHIQGYIASNENRLLDFIQSHSFSNATNKSFIRGYKISINEIKNINKSKIELFLNDLKSKANQESEKTKMTEISYTNSKNIWKDIEKEYGINKRAFGRKINFVTDKFKKSLIFRDIEQAFVLANLGFSKPAVILSGSVIEELLRLYLEHNKVKPARDDFNNYIKACEENGLLKSAISRLSDSVRHFRNIVHLSKEETSRYTISKATAKGAVSSIFTIANDF